MDKPIAGSYRFDDSGRIAAIYDGEVWLAVAAEPTLMSLQLEIDALKIRIDKLEQTPVLSLGCRATAILKKSDEMGKFRMAAEVVCSRPINHTGDHFDGYSTW